MADEFTAKFKVDITDLKKNITDATKQIKLANATFKAETAGMGQWSKDADGLSKKLNQLKTVLASQKTILASYKSQLTEQQKGYEENGKKAEALKAKLQELANDGVAKTDAEYKKYETALKNVLKEQQNNEKAIDDLNITILEQQAAVNKTEGDIKHYSTALDNLETEQKQAAEAAKKQKTAYESLEDTIDSQQSELKDLKSKYANVVLEQGKNSDSAKDLAGQIDKLSSELGDNKKKLTEADKAADDLDKSLDDVGKSAEDTSGGFTVMRGALADLVAKGITAAVNGLKNLATSSYEAWKSDDDGADTVIAATGATGEAAEGLIGVYDEVSKSVVGDLGDIGTAVGEVNTRFGLTGDELEDTSKKFLKFAEINGVDVKTAIDNTQSAMAAFGIESKDTSKFIDVLNKAGQDTGVSVDKLAESMVKNGPALKEMGLGASDSAMFLANLSKSGLDTSTVMAGMKKALTNAAKEGKPLSDAMAEAEAAIKGASNSTDAITAATELFGTKAGPAIAAAVRDGKLSFDDFGTTLTDFQGNVETTYDEMLDGPDKVALAMQNLKVEAAKTFDEFLQRYGPQIEKAVTKFTDDILPGVMNAVGKVMDGIDWFAKNLPTIIALVTGLGTAFAIFALQAVGISGVVTALKNLTIVQKAVTAAQWLMNAAMNMNPIGIVIALVAGLVAAFVVLWKKSDKFRQFWINLWNKIKSVCKPVIEAIAKWFSETWQKIQKVWSTVSNWFNTKVITPVKNFFSNLKENVTKFFSEAWTGIKNIWSKVADWFNNHVVTPVKNFFSPLVEWFTNLFTSIKDFIKSVFGVIGELAKGCVTIIKTVWGVVKTWFKEKVTDPVKEKFTNLFTAIKDKAKAAWTKIKEIWSVVKTWFKEKITDPVKNAFSGAWTSLKNGAKNAWSGIKETFGKVPAWFKDKFSDAWQKVKNVFSTGGKIFSGIKDGIVSAFKTVVNAIIRGINRVIAIPFNAINNVLDKIRNASFLGISPFKGLGSISVPQIPTLATGGVLKRGQVGLLEGNGAEAVVPLEKNKQWIRAVANDLYKELQGVRAGNSVSNMSKNNVTNFTQNIYAPKQPSRIEIYRDTRNLLAYAKGVN